jgi:signal transduction histidine kinase
MNNQAHDTVDSEKIASTLAEIARLLESDERAEARILRVLELLRDIVPFGFCALLTGSSKDSPLLTVPEADERRRSALRSWLLRVMCLMEGRNASDTTGPDRSRVVLPVIGGDHLIGILQVESSSAYDVQHVQLLSAVASQLGAYLAMVGLVSECKLAEATIRYQEERLRKTEKLAVAGRLAGSLSHEINNPLEAVANVFYLLQHHLERHSILNQEPLNWVRAGAGELARVSRIVRQNLSYYREGQTPHDLDFGELLNESLRIFDEKFHKAGIELTKRIEPDTLLLGFPDEIRQVIDNLLLNALEATPTGGPCPHRCAPLFRLGAPWPPRYPLNRGRFRVWHSQRKSGACL